MIRSWIQSPDAGRSRQSGFSYVMVLILAVTLTILALTFVYRAGIGASGSMDRLRHMQAEYLAEAAANHAMWRLLNQPDFPQDESTYYMHSLGDWRYGYRVRRHTNKTFATVAVVGVAGESVARHSYVLYVLP